MAEEEKKEAPEVVTPQVPHRSKRVVIAVGGIVALLIAVGVPTGYFLLKEEP